MQGMASPLAQSQKLADLAAQAAQRQLETGTTAPSLDHLDAGRRTVRLAMSLALVGGSHGQTFLLHREPMVTKKTPPGEPPPATIYRAAIFGGGMESVEERRFADMVREDPLSIDPALLSEAGGVPPDYWYRRQGKHMLAHGHLEQMTYPVTQESILACLRSDLARRMGMEVGTQSLGAIGAPIALQNAQPVETNVLNRRLGNFTEPIAARHGLSVNAAGELVGIGITVRERFAMARLLTDPARFQALTRGNALAWPVEHLIAVAERDTRDATTWAGRLGPQFQMSDDTLPIRNHSLLLAAAGALAHLHGERGWRGWLRRLRQGRLSG